MDRLIIKVLVFAFVVFLITPAFADNSQRIAELQNKVQSLGKEIAQAQQYIQQKQAEGMEAVGAIKELQAQDAKAKEVEVKKDETKKEDK